jgi:hypothetical protein
MFRKGIVLVVIILLVGVSIPSTGMVYNDDTTPPEIELHWEAYKKDEKWYIRFNATCFDNESGMNRVEFFYNSILQEIIFGLGPLYEWELKLETESYTVKGFICHRRATEENISFFALMVWNTVDYNFDLGDIVEAYAYDNAGNWNYDDAFDTFWSPGMPYFLKHFSFYNQYKGYIGRFLISAEFENEPYDIGG